MSKKKEDKEIEELAEMISNQIMNELTESDPSKFKDMLIDARIYGIASSVDESMMIIRAIDIVGLPNGHTVTFLMAEETAEKLAHDILGKIKPKETH